jgi:hypothetical protein
VDGNVHEPHLISPPPKCKHGKSRKPVKSEKKLLAPEYLSLIACIIDDECQGEGQTHMKLLENIASAFGIT